MSDIRYLAGQWGGRGALLAGILAPALLVTAIVWAGFMETEYSHAHQFVSELGAAGVDHQWILNNLGLVPSGFLTTVFSVGLYFRLRPGGWLATSCALVALAGIGRLVAGVYPCDAGCSLEGMSMSARIHAQAGFVALVSGALAPIVLAFGLRRRSENLLLLVSAGMGSVSVVAVMFLFGLGPGVAYIGTIQRLILATFYGWIVFLVIAVGALQQQTRERVKAP